MAPPEILTDFQKRVLVEISLTPLSETFYLTGGTALSAFYLGHRFSDDLDFFTDDPGAVPRVLPALEMVASALPAALSVRRQFRTYLEVALDSGSETLKVDFAVDSPYRLEAVRKIEGCPVAVNNPTDMACNKLSALFDRNDPKDFVDIYFIDRDIIPLPRLIDLAKQKHIGMDDYWLAVAFGKCAEIAILPRMIRPVTIQAIRDFYEKAAKRLVG